MKGRLYGSGRADGGNEHYTCPNRHVWTAAKPRKMAPDH